jgi:hypothetical protein
MAELKRQWRWVVVLAAATMIASGIAWMSRRAGHFERLGAKSRESETFYTELVYHKRTMIRRIADRSDAKLAAMNYRIRNSRRLSHADIDALRSRDKELGSDLADLQVHFLDLKRYAEFSDHFARLRATYEYAAAHPWIEPNIDRRGAVKRFPPIPD